MKAVALLAVVLIAAPAMADLVTVAPAPFDGAVSTAGSYGTRTVPVYDNTINASGYYHNAAGAEEGDDLEMVAGGVLDHFAFGYYDPADDGAVTTTADIRFYDAATFAGDGTDIPLATYNVTDLPGEGGWIVGVDVDNGVNLPDYVVMSMQLDNTLSAGPLIYDPPTIGTSQDMFWINGTGWVWFGGSPVANLAFEVETVPEPASLALLALGSLALLRRR